MTTIFITKKYRKLPLTFKQVYNIQNRILFYGDFTYMATTILPSIFVPLVGIMFPLIAISGLFIYIETENKEIFDSAEYKF